MTKTQTKKSTIRALGEINLWVKDYSNTPRFYENVLGLRPVFKNEKHVFLKAAEGYGGHPQTVGLFNSGYNEKGPPDVERTTLYHLAFIIDPKDFEKEKTRLEDQGIKVNVELHREAHWRSMYFLDPEGNQLEFVAYDKKLR